LEFGICVLEFQFRTFALVSNLLRLLERYRDDERTEKICTALKAETPARLQIAGTLGAQDTFVLTGTYLAHPHNIMLVAANQEQAAYLQNNLKSFFERKPILFFPDSFKKPAKFDEFNKHNVLMRVEAMSKFVGKTDASVIIVTYPEALFEKVVAPAVLEDNRIDVAAGESLDVDTIVSVLVEYGFEHSEFVYEPGQFSIRGGIVDIFSYGNDQPYRIELFDDEIESIRTFNPANQLSTRKIAKVTIVPNIQSHFTTDQKTSILNILPKNTSIWIKDIQTTIDRLQTCFEKATEFANLIQERDESDEAGFLKNRDFIFPKDVIQGLLDFHIVEINNRSFFGENVGRGFLPTAPSNGGDSSLREELPDDNNFVLEGKNESSFSLREKSPSSEEAGGRTSRTQKFTYNSKPQPSFNKNFELLMDNLKTNTIQQIENYIFTDNARQIKRFESIFEDLEADVHYHPVTQAIHEGFVDLDLKVACYTDHQIFERYHKYQIKKGYSKSEALNVKLLRELQPGDFVTHIDHGVGRYSGLEKINLKGHIQEAVRLIYRDNDVLYVSINSLHKISKYVGKEGKAPKLTKLGTDTWAKLKQKTKRKVKDIAAELIKLYAQRRAAKGFAFPPDGHEQNELEASFIYEDTPDQYKATNDVKADMQKEYPMDRLICGDVGFGKTEVAIRAAFKAIDGGKQVAILVPTTILALQHYHTFKNRLAEFGAKVDYLNRFRTAKEKRILLEGLESGEVDIVIGTHGLLGKKVKFKDLGLLVVDEEQKFGVAAKEKLRTMKVNVDTLTLTATPIPRTLQFTLMAARDLSVINTPPPNRQPIHTEVRVFNDKLIQESIYYEIYRGGQVFFLHNRVKELPDMMAMLGKLCPDVDIAMAHGQMEANQLETTLLDFIKGRYDILCCTNIIETGLDIANANTIIINNAHHFGLSDLHQLRGRVGRSNKKAFCYLFCPPMSVLTSEARKRLQTIEEFADLGSGFNISMRDLDIRGAGNILGGEQSGFITDIGYETYQKILDEAIQELKETDFKELFKEDLQKERKFVRDVHIETDIEMLIPDGFVNNIQERLNLYTALDKIKNESELEIFSKEMRDRFGHLPHSILELFDALRLRWLCKELGFERLILKSRKLRCYFISNEQSPYFESDVFHHILQYVPKKADRKMTFKKTSSYFILIRDDVKSLQQAKGILEDIKGSMGEG